MARAGTRGEKKDIMMRTCISLRNTRARDLPPQFQDDVRYADSLVEFFMRELTQPGDVVFDPFAGYGTTLIVAEAMGREAFGIEFDPARARYIQGQLRHPDHLIQGDSRQLLSYDVPCFDLSLTSPPYMCKDDVEDPFTNYTTVGQGYRAYLQTLQQIYQQMATLMSSGAYVVVEVANLKEGGRVTPLAWDVGQAIGQILTFQGEIIVDWDTYGYGYDHSYGLVFTA